MCLFCHFVRLMFLQLLLHVESSPGLAVCPKWSFIVRPKPSQFGPRLLLLPVSPERQPFPKAAGGFLSVFHVGLTMQSLCSCSFLKCWLFAGALFSSGQCILFIPFFKNVYNISGIYQRGRVIQQSPMYISSITKTTFQRENERKIQRERELNPLFFFPL